MPFFGWRKRAFFSFLAISNIFGWIFHKILLPNCFFLFFCSCCSCVGAVFLLAFLSSFAIFYFFCLDLQQGFVFELLLFCFAGPLQSRICETNVLEDTINIFFVRFGSFPLATSMPRARLFLFFLFSLFFSSSFCVPRARARRCLSFWGRRCAKYAVCFSLFCPFMLLLFSVFRCFFFFLLRFPFPFFCKKKICRFRGFPFEVLFFFDLFPFCRVADALRLHATRLVRCFFVF